MRISEYLIFVLLICGVFASTLVVKDEESFNKTDSEKVLTRNKRFLVFVPNGGTLKFVTGYLGPIDIPAWQNINCLRNMQFQYDLPQKLVTSSTSWPGFLTPPGSRSFDGDNKVDYKPDKSREIAYGLVENMLNREGKNGHECLLRTICEVAETPVNHNGLIGELLQLFFTPGAHEKLHEDYRLARKAGLNNINCEKLYPSCPFGHGMLDSISLIKNYKFENLLNF